LKLLYAEKELPKFSFIVVTKKINTRMFEAGTKGNPPAGTIADDVITLPERYVVVEWDITSTSTLHLINTA
jgi:hypothetical protein